MAEKITCPNCLSEHFSEFKIKPNDKRIFKGKCKTCSNMIRFKLNNNSNNNDDANNGLLDTTSISFTINGTKYEVTNDYPFTTTLNEYLRNILGMTGTKVMCREGGCGSCLVNLEVYDYDKQTTVDIAINSCLFPLYSCNNLVFTTVEGIGGKQTGFNEIQKRLADNNGSQCGWCSTGMVMNMYSLLLNNPKPTKSQIESSFDGNICRCTGYRSILDAMKSFATDEKPIDIEELSKLKCLNNKNNSNSHHHSHSCRSKPNSNNINNKSITNKIHIIKEDDDSEWYSPNSMKEVYQLLVEYESSNYRIVSGNTGVGVYKNEGPFNVYIDLKNVQELSVITRSATSLSVGSQITIKKLIDLFVEYSQSVVGFEYLSEISNHLGKIANVGIRNTATWAGNLFMKYNHNDFPSDVFVCFETINALITIVGPDQSTPSVQLTPSQFLSYSQMKGKILYSIEFGQLDKSKTFIKTYKIMPRSQNAHAYVNAGFRFSVDTTKSYRVLSQPSIVFGGISGTFIHASKTESYLFGKSLSDETTLTTACAILNSEIVPNDDPVLASVDYRKSLAISLFYKFILYVNQNNPNLNPTYKSAIDSLIDTRDISSGTQSYQTNPSMYPVTKPMTKLNAYLQTSGEAQYVYDMPLSKNGLHGAFIQTTKSNCRIAKIDTTNALSMPGVVRILFAKDIPGKNSFVPSPSSPELLFCYDKVDYAGQAVGLVIAETFEQALSAAKAVVITYNDLQIPILSVQDAIKAGSFFPNPPSDFIYGNAEQAISNSPNVIEGDCSLGAQFHFYMENQVAVSKPTDDGFDIYCSTQWLDLVQNGVAQVLGLQSSCINVRIKQLGGAYGGKITRSNITATAAALASKVLDKEVRVLLDLNGGMELIGKRFPWYAKYKIGFDNNGKILGIILNVYNDCGNSSSDSAISAAPQFADNTYSCKNWHITFQLAKTNLPANTACRSPGTFPSIALMECMIEHVIKYLKADPVQVRQLNLYSKGDTTPGGQPLPYFNVDSIISNLLESSQYSTRLKEISDYNSSNRWKKRGLSLTPIKWGAGWNGGAYNVIISIYASDGSISLFHSGVEVGQGIHTKVVQVCAYELGVPIETISIKYADNLTNPNSAPTGGSITSELVSSGVIECCKIINTKLDPVRKLMPAKYTWADLIAKAFSMGVDLTSHYWVYPQTPSPFAYNVYGAAVSESIVDALTGEFQILRTDILYDCGQSINGEIDIGQAEGAFVMGMGFWFFEKVKYDPYSGALLTNGTWEYKPPTTKDIPVDLRITFLQNNPNPLGVLGSKCIGEPPLCLTPSVAFAVKRAIEASRAEIDKDVFFALNSPTTVETIQQLCLIDYTQFKFY